MSKAGERILAGIAEARAFARGVKTGARVVTPGELVKRLREREQLTQAQFAKMFAIPVGTVRDWEQGRREPDAPARTLLRVIEHNASAVRRALDAA